MTEPIGPERHGFEQGPERHGLAEDDLEQGSGRDGSQQDGVARDVPSGAEASGDASHESHGSRPDDDLARTEPDADPARTEPRRR